MGCGLTTTSCRSGYGGSKLSTSMVLVNLVYRIAFADEASSEGIVAEMERRRTSLDVPVNGVIPFVDFLEACISWTRNASTAHGYEDGYFALKMTKGDFAHTYDWFRLLEAFPLNSRNIVDAFFCRFRNKKRPSFRRWRRKNQ